MRPPAAVAAAALALSTAGCGGWQSVLDPHSPGAGEIATLWWIMFWTTGLLSTGAIAGLLYAVHRARRAGVAEAGGTVGDRERRFIVLAGAGIPAAVLVSFVVLSVRTGGAVSEPPGEPGLTVEVEGHKFWWHVRYPDHGVVTANEIHIPAGVAVDVRVTSADVIHSFWVPQLSPGKIDMIPGRTNRIWMLAEEPGLYRGQCTEFCGSQHALMSLLVVASGEEDFQEWLEARSAPAGVPTDAAALRGQEVFFEAGCAACHAIRGVNALAFAGSPGPDLTHVGTRRTLGALTVENTRAHLAAWILDPHQFKPGVRMPPTILDGDDLGALVHYLESLR